MFEVLTSREAARPRRDRGSAVPSGSAAPITPEMTVGRSTNTLLRPAPRFQIRTGAADTIVLALGFCIWVAAFALSGASGAAAPGTAMTVLGLSLFCTMGVFFLGGYKASARVRLGSVLSMVPLAFGANILRHLLLPSPGPIEEAWWVTTGQSALLAIGLQAMALELMALAMRSGLVAQRHAFLILPGAEQSPVVDRLKSDPKVHVALEADLTGLETTILAARVGRLDGVVLVAKNEDKDVAPILSALACSAVDIALVNGCKGAVMHESVSSQVPDDLVWLRRERQTGAAYAVKRLADIVGALLALTILSPLLLVIALLVRLDSPGPALFRQERFGYRGRPFTIWKFRSMRNDAADATGSKLTDRNDVRVTRIGGFLRRSSLDELPQLVNILTGDLSFVGPRPHPSGAKANGILYDDLIPDFKARYRVRPGVTGLAQCMGLRGNTDTEKKLLDRFEADMRYVETWSLGLDFVIVVRTIGHLMRAQNAF